jgi:beta-lactamase class A
VEASVSKLDVLGAVLRAEQAGASVDDDVTDDEAAMIEHSSNDAAVELYNRVGQDGIEDFDEAVGATDVAYAEAGYFGLDTSTALDQVQIMKAYAYPGAVLTPASQAQATALFGQVEADQHWGASGGVPAGVTVDLKNGWLPHGTGWVVNTVGHVQGQGHDYVVAIMSAGNSTEQAGIDRLETVSAAVWATSGS